MQSSGLGHSNPKQQLQLTLQCMPDFRWADAAEGDLCCGSEQESSRASVLKLPHRGKVLVSVPAQVQAGTKLDDKVLHLIWMLSGCRKLEELEEIRRECTGLLRERFQLEQCIRCACRARCTPA